MKLFFKTEHQHTVIAAALLSAGALFPSLATNLFSAGALEQLAQNTQVDNQHRPQISPALSAAATSLKVWFINVGQGDSEYIELPDGKNALIDGGPDSTRLMAFLDSRKIKKIDYLVLTHPHPDHCAGLLDVAKSFQIGKFYDTGMDNIKSTADDELRKILRDKTIYPKAGDKLDWAGGVEVKVLHSLPESARSGKSQELNAASMVLKLTYNNSSILFTADIETETEKKLLVAVKEELKSDVLKVPHHGSLSDSAFLQAVSPKAAYIEVGQNNYGSPTPATIKLLENLGAKVFRTDKDGTLEYEIK